MTGATTKANAEYAAAEAEKTAAVNSLAAAETEKAGASTDE